MGGVTEIAQATVAYEHAGGQEYMAENMESAHAMCPVLGKLSLEEAGLLLELEAMGLEQLSADSDKSETESDQEQERVEHKPADSPKVVEPAQVEQSLSQKQGDGVSANRGVHNDELLAVQQKLVNNNEQDSTSSEVEPSNPAVAEVAVVQKSKDVIESKSFTAEKPRRKKSTAQTTKPNLIDDLGVQPASVNKQPVDDVELKAEIKSDEATYETSEPSKAISEPDVESVILRIDSETVSMQPNTLEPPNESVDVLSDKEMAFQERTVDDLVQAIDELEPAETAKVHALLDTAFAHLREVTQSAEVEAQKANTAELVQMFEEIFEEVGVTYSPEEVERFVRNILKTVPDNAETEIEVLESINHALGDQGTHEGLLYLVKTNKSLKKLSISLHSVIGRLVLLPAMLTSSAAVL